MSWIDAEGRCSNCYAKLDGSSFEGGPPKETATPDLRIDGIAPDAAVQWLHEAAQYFEKRDTGREDRAHWSNVYNAENCRKIAALIQELRSNG